ncbi:hypothetical protein [Salinigranum sp. GCM10025319]|uniref:hypothetical protein n=1 Tax=Salinigranum sp. GCM10025319 TaxID=3252687 RepID=UPI0036191BF7
MSEPTGPDASTDAKESTHEPTGSGDVEESTDVREITPPGDSTDVTDPSRSLSDIATDWARHWKAWTVAGFSLLVVGWAAFVQPQASPKGYIPIFAALALMAAGYVYLNEETTVRFASA